MSTAELKTSADTGIHTESLMELYQRWGVEIPADILLSGGTGCHFNVRETFGATRKTPFNRRDYYKICLTTNIGKGSGTLYYNDQEIDLDQPCMLFGHPSIPLSVEISAAPVSRFQCFFNSRFIDGLIPPDVQFGSSLFNPELHPMVTLTIEERDRMRLYFKEMQTLKDSDYPFRWEMVRNILQLVIHEGIRLQQKQSLPTSAARDRLVSGFLTLLNQQFPVDSSENDLKLLTPAYFADLLHVHVNHLNAMVKKQTGKTTRGIIQERVFTEAKALLRNTNWNIAEIAYSLGFEYPSHFNKYFRQLANMAPMEFRTYENVRHPNL